jgi:Tol biopolymer transport system component
VRRFLVVVLLSACSLDEIGIGTSTDAGKDVGAKDVTILDVTANDVISDAPTDVPTTGCNPTAAFGNMNAVQGAVNTPAYESTPMLTPDELGMFFARDTGGGKIGLFYAARGATNQPFAIAAELSLSSNQSIDTSPWVDDTMSTMLFASERNGDKHYHLYQADGDGTFDGWSNITALDALNRSDPVADLHPWLAPATGEVWFASDRLGTLDLYYASDVNSTPNLDTTLSTIAFESHPVLTADALTIFFERTDIQNKGHIFSATRATTSSSWGNVVQLTEFDTGQAQSAPGWISADGCRMYFSTDRSGGFDIWMATRGS